MTLKEAVVEYRIMHKISQRQFAEMCGVSNGFISMLEKGYNPNTKEPIVPSLPTLKKIANGMGMSLHDFFAIVDDMPVSLEKDDLDEVQAKEAFSKKEIELVHAYRKATPDEQGAVDLILKKYTAAPSKLKRA